MQGSGRWDLQSHSRLGHQRLPVDAQSAQALYTGILTDTGQFRFNSTSRRCFSLAGELVARGAKPAEAGYELYERETEGKLKDCWVMPASAFSTDTASEDNKVIVRSNGTVTYVGKDIAYQLWKFGLLGKDFYYRPLLRYPDGHELWVTTDQPADGASSPGFGHGERRADRRQSGAHVSTMEG